MTPDPSAGERVEAVLVEWYLAIDRGDEPDLLELCGGDERLAARVGSLLEDAPDVLRPISKDEAPVEEQGDSPGGLRPGARLGEFRLLKPLGSGGMGSVYLAEQDSPSRRVALKVLGRGQLIDSHARLRFRREADLAASLNHPNIVPIYAVGEEDGQAYIAMKRLAGPSLDRLELPLAPREVARIGEKIARALEEAHLCGVVHRDVKPSNVLLDGDEPVLVDFGLARAATDLTITRAGNVAGTLPYVAPELLRADGPRLDPRIDVYALGATLYELLAGKPPFGPGVTEALLAQIAFKEPPPLRLNGGDRDLGTIVEKALEKDPARRIPSARILADELRRYLAGEAIELEPITRLDRLVRLARRHARLTAAAALVLVLVITLASLAAASRIRERRALGQAVELAREEMGRGAHARACEILEELPAGEPVVRDLLAEARANLALDGLLDEVIVLGSAIHAEELRERVEAVRSTGAVALRPDLARLGLALAAWHLEDPDAARAELAALGDASGGRAAQAIAQLIEGTSEPLEDGAPVDPDQHVLAAVAVHLAGRPEEQEKELQLALAQDPLHRRARYALAIAWEDEGRYADAILVLSELLRGKPRHRGYLRNLVRALAWTGDRAGARRDLARIPEVDWSPIEATLDLNLLWLEEDWARYEERLDGFLADLEAGRWEAGGELLRSQAAYLGTVQRDWDRASEILERVAREGDDYVNRDLAAAAGYRLKVDRLFVETPDPYQRAEQLEPLLDEGDRLLEELRFPRARGVAGWKHGMALLGAGYADDGFRQLAAAVPLLPGDPWPRFEYMRELLGFAAHLRQGGTKGLGERMARHLELEAWKQARDLAPVVLGQGAFLGVAELADLRNHTLEAARRVEDWSLIEALLERRLEESPGDAARRQIERELEQVRENLAGAYGG